MAAGGRCNGGPASASRARPGGHGGGGEREGAGRARRGRHGAAPGAAACMAVRARARGCGLAGSDPYACRCAGPRVGGLRRAGVLGFGSAPVMGRGGRAVGGHSGGGPRGPRGAQRAARPRRGRAGVAGARAPRGGFFVFCSPSGRPTRRSQRRGAWGGAPRLRGGAPRWRGGAPAGGAGSLWAGVQRFQLHRERGRVGSSSACYAHGHMGMGGRGASCMGPRMGPCRAGVGSSTGAAAVHGVRASRGPLKAGRLLLVHCAGSGRGKGPPEPGRARRRVPGPRVGSRSGGRCRRRGRRGARGWGSLTCGPGGDPGRARDRKENGGRALGRQER
jgi:hypothetical protein